MRYTTLFPVALRLLLITVNTFERDVDAFSMSPVQTMIATTGGREEVIRIFATRRSEEELIQMAKAYIDKPTPEQLSEDFIFRGPVIGPLCKKDFVAVLTSVSAVNKAGLADAFPDLEPNNFGFTVDPVEPNRVWYLMRARGTFLGPFDHPTSGRIEPTGAKYIAPPEARSIIFDDEGKVKYQSVGYVMDRFTGDTTKGKGAVFGAYEVMGESLDDTIGSWKMMFLQWVASLLPESLDVPKAYSKEEDLPAWWTDKRKGAQR